MRKQKPVDPIAIKVAIKQGQLIVYEKDDKIYIKDAPEGDTVCIFNRKEGKT